MTGKPGAKGDIQIYCNCIERVRHHVSISDNVFAGRIDTGHHDLNAELIFLHFRKTLEEIAFASLSANREEVLRWRAADLPRNGTPGVCLALSRR